jgi:hypothetical protein
MTLGGTAAWFFSGQIHDAKVESPLWDLLQGPSSGTVHLPSHLDWSALMRRAGSLISAVPS